MAVSSIAVPPDPERDARARELAPLVGTWPKHTLRQAWGSFEAGTTFRRAPASNGTRRYLVNAVACSCPDYQQGGYICKHVRAVVLFEARQQPSAPTPKRQASYEELFPACGCGDLADGSDGLCSHCASELAWQQTRNRQRELLADQ
jgi:hypothetical protein